MQWRHVAARALGWVTTLPYRWNRNVHVGPRLLHISGDYDRLVKDLGGNVTWTAQEAAAPQPVDGWCKK